MIATFRLYVERIEKQQCRFELSSHRGRLAPVMLPYPVNLGGLYEDWHTAYLNHYQQASWPTLGWRGRLEESGSLRPNPPNWDERVEEAEAKLLREFNNWLRSPELQDLWDELARAAREISELGSRREPADSRVHVFLTCDPDLAYLPWEVWKIPDSFARPGTICLARVPYKRVADWRPLARRPRKARVLALWGDETGLDFQGDRDAMQKLQHLAEIHSLCWNTTQSASDLKAQIQAALADEQGWDVLFYAGHSDETELTGGKLALGPGTSVLLSVIESHLKQARDRGLQFAIFNSCSGLSIAESLIAQVGLGQVVVMREPIHNRVAQEFLVQFLQSLAAQRDVHESCLTACQYLLENRLNYPSAYLIPSLFRHPDAPLFRLEPFGWQAWLQRVRPTRAQAIALSALVLLSWSTQVQSWLLNQRLWVQAAYRHVTHQIPTAPPPVLLVQIDEKSIQQARISQPNPMDRRYLAGLVTQISTLGAPVIGLDYVLDRSHQDRNGGISDRLLAQALQAAVARSPHPTWLVLATAELTPGDWLDPLPEIASPNWTLQGHIHVPFQYLPLDSGVSPTDKLPFAYLLALAARLDPTQQTQLRLPLPRLNSQSDLFSQVDQALQAQGRSYRSFFAKATQLQPLTSWAYDLGQMWLNPIIDFSLPPEHIYQAIPAWQVLSSHPSDPQWHHLSQQVVVVASHYSEAGLLPGNDNYAMPLALQYWMAARGAVPRQSLSGGEYQTYVLHHFLTQHLVVPIPDLWLVGLVLVLGNWVAIATPRQPMGRWRWVSLGLVSSGFYGWVSLQVYVTGAVLLPWMLPTLTFWVYVLPKLQLSKRRAYVQA